MFFTGKIHAEIFQFILLNSKMSASVLSTYINRWHLAEDITSYIFNHCHVDI